MRIKSASIISSVGTLPSSPKTSYASSNPSPKRRHHRNRRDILDSSSGKVVGLARKGASMQMPSFFVEFEYFSRTRIVVVPQ
jgi:hypothetical protein